MTPLTDEEQLAQLQERQRREAELFAEIKSLEGSEAEEDEYDDDEVDKSSLRHIRPPIPDMRFEKQFERTVNTLKEKGASNTSIILSAVIKDQIIMQFITGFTWSLAGHLWRWYRLPKRRVNTTTNNKESFSYLRGIKYGLGRWLSNTYHNLVHLPSLAGSSPVA
ncbi:unnamed protein product [Cunninghamella blakesleeana]